VKVIRAREEERRDERMQERERGGWGGGGWEWQGSPIGISSGASWSSSGVDTLRMSVILIIPVVAPIPHRYTASMHGGLSLAVSYGAV